MNYSIKLSDGNLLTGLDWHDGRFWTPEDFRKTVTPEQLSKIEVICNDEIITDPEQEGFTGNFLEPGEYVSQEFRDYRKDGDLYRFYLAGADE